MQEVDSPPEDDVSIAAHLKALQQECSKANPSSVVIAEKMARTISHRTEAIRTTRIGEVLAIYPCLHVTL